MKRGSAISTKCDPNLEGQDLVQDEQSGKIKDQEEEQQNAVVEESKTDEAEISILWGLGI